MLRSVTVVVAASKPRLSRPAAARRSLRAAMRATRSAGTRRTMALSRRDGGAVVVAAGAAVKDEASELGRRVGVQVRNGSLNAWVEKEQDWVMVLV